MGAWRKAIHVVALVTLGGAMGCADLLGADFDVHRASPQGLDAARDATNGGADRSEGISQPPPGGTDGGRDGHTIFDGVPGAPDVGDDGARNDASRADAADAANAGGSGGGRDVEYNDAADANDPWESGDWPDGGNIPDAPDPADSSDGSVAPDARDARNGSDPIDGGTEPPPDGPRTTGIAGGFVSLGMPGNRSPTIQLRGHFIPNTVIRGVTSSGITIEGKIQ